MILRQIKLENFLSHEDLEIAFPKEGTFLLTGKSGIGKSSLIIDAIAYSLYGAIATRGKKQTDLRNNDTPNQPMRVDTVWDFQDETVTFSRGIDGKNSSWAKAYQAEGDDSVILAEGIKPVSRIVLKRMGGMNWQQFYSAFVARQAEINLLTTLKGSQRKDLIHKMLGMRELEKSEQIITTKLRRLRALGDQLEKATGGINLLDEKEKLNSLNKELESIEKEIAEKRNLISKNEKSKTEIEKEITDTKKNLDILSQKESLDLEIQGLEESLKSIDKAARDHKEAEAALEGVSLEKMGKELDDLKLERQRLRDLFLHSKEMVSISEELSQFEDSYKKLISKIKKSVPAYTKEDISSDKIEELGEKTVEDIADLKEDLDILEKRINDLKENDECFVCKRKFADKHDHDLLVKNLGKDIDKLKTEIQEKENLVLSVENIKPTLLKLPPLEKEIETKKTKIASLKNLGAESDVSKIKALGEKVSESIKTSEEELAKYRAFEKNINNDLADRFEKTEKRIDDLKKQLPSLENIDLNSKKIFEDLEKKKTSLELDIASDTAALSQMEKLLNSKKSEVEAQEKAISGREHEFKELEKIKDQTEIAEAATLMIRGYQKHLTSEIRPAIEEIASEMITRISEGRHTAIKINDEYEISVEKSSGAIIPAGLLSGGEEIRANICLRLALTRLVSQRTGIPVGFLILDEPLPAQDSDHVEKIMELLQSLRPFYRQQFIISHVGELRSDDSVDYILEFDRSPSGKTEVILVNA